jgi:TolB-like protein/DNA-binding winged helix-turn-helix (wHTH) protein
MSKTIIRFEGFELDPSAFELRKSGSLVRLERIPLELLLFLAERRGQLVTRQEILERIWGKDVFVDADNSINTAIRKIRLALQEEPDNPRFLRTVPGKGYRFVPELVAEAAPDSVANGSSADLPGVKSWPFWKKQWVLWATMGAALLIAVVAGIPRVLRPAKGPTAAKMKLVVLPFVNLTGDPGQEYFADGMTEEIITQLGGLDPERLGVIARTSSMHYKDAKKDAGQIAKELGVNYLLEGSIRRDGSRVRVAAQLIRASDQTHVWAGNFEEGEKDILRLESDLALAISGKTALTLSPSVRARLSDRSAVNAEAYQAYLTAKQAFELRTKSGIERSIAEYRRAIVLEPDYASSYAGLATVYSLAPVMDAMSPLEAMPKAKEAAQRAIRLDESLAAGHTALAFILAHYDFDWPAAEREFRRGIELNPNDASAHFFYSNSFLSPMGRHNEAIAEMKKAIELDPLSPAILSFSGQTPLWARRYEEGLGAYKQCAEQFPGYAINHERIAHIYTYTGRIVEAIAEDTRAKILNGEAPEAAMQQDAALRKALAIEGPSGYWKKLLEFGRLPGSPPETYRTPQQLAIIYTRLGHRNQALSLLEEAYEVRSLGLTEMAVEPAFEPLHSEPRFQDLCRKLGLPLSSGSSQN